MTNREKLNAMTDKELSDTLCELVEKVAEKVDIFQCRICPAERYCQQGRTGFLKLLGEDSAKTPLI